MKLSWRQFRGMVQVGGVFLAVVFCLEGQGQGAVASDPKVIPAENLDGIQIREIHPRPTPTPFPLDVREPAVASLTFLSPQAMTDADRDLLAANEAEVSRRAQVVGYRLDVASGEQASPESAWGYEQAVCPAFPDHLIIAYSRLNSSQGRADVSLFTAVIPRGSGGRSTGHVRVIPAQRRSYSLFTPVASNALTINDFNHMVSEEPRGLSPDWLGLGLCYTALASGHVRAALVASHRAYESYPLLTPAKLTVSKKGGAEVLLANETPGGEPSSKSMDWTLIFAQSGRLMKVRHVDSNKLVERGVAGQAVEAQGVPTRQQVMDVPAAP